MTRRIVPIVAIGASAGGLEPFERFFDAMNDDVGAAYVIIQHLSPNFQSMMDELLARHSSMAISFVTNDMKIRPNTIYLNPPRTEMTVENGRFVLAETNKNNLLNLPIDTFFSSLAKEAGENAIAVVLSGTGSDGTKGAEAIKAAGGAVMAQDLKSAKFDGMPSSIINAGLADMVGHPQLLAKNVALVLMGKDLNSEDEFDEPRESGVSLTPKQTIFNQLHERFGTQFGYYKPATIERRLERRANLRSITLAEYSDVLIADPSEVEALYADLLIEVTSFFRDQEAFEALRTKVIPQLGEKMSRATPVRVWVPGCASGEEAYSIAILMADYARENKIDLHLKIMATDIHHRSLSAASTGIYPREILGALSAEQIDRYFEENDGVYQITPNLRRMVVFSPHDILRDPPFTRMDLVSCRNVLIYFNDLAQKKTLALFHFALRPNGFLYLGPSETAGPLDHEFDVLDGRWRIFAKRRDVKLSESVSLLPNGNEGSEQPGFSNLENLESSSLRRRPAISTRQAHNDGLKEMLRRYAPPGFLLDTGGRILHVFGDAGKHLNVDSGSFSDKISDMVDDNLKLIIAAGMERLRGTVHAQFERRVNDENEALGKHTVVVRLNRVGGESTMQPYLLLTIERVEERADPLELLEIPALDNAEASSILQTRIAELDRDLKATEESLQSTIEELETSNEELQATNEELMASNEELQSTNEELHSVNEELYTVSTEHQKKIEELMEVTDDMDHLLRATDIGIVFLDDQMAVRRFTPTAKNVFNILAQDIGRPFSHITYQFDDPKFLDKVQKVRVSGEPIEQEIELDERSYMLRILPYRLSLADIEGAVITVMDITEIKLAEEKRSQTTFRYESIVRDMTGFVLRWSPETGKITYCNDWLAKEMGVSVEDIVGRNIDSIGPNKKKGGTFGKITELKKDSQFENEILRYDASGREVYVSGTVRPIRDEDGKVVRMQATGQDVTSQFLYRTKLEELLSKQEAPNAGNEDKLIAELISIGCDYLDLPRAVVSEFGDENCVALASVGYAAGEMKKGLSTPFKSSFLASLPMKKDELLLVEDMSKSKASIKKLASKTDAKSVVASHIQTVNGFKGQLAFTDTVQRDRPFTTEEQMFIRLIAQSLEHVLERREFLDDLEYRHQHYVSVYDQAPIMRCTVNAQGEIQEANAVWLETLGYTAKSTLGKNFTDFLGEEGFEQDWPKFPVINSKAGTKFTTQATLKGKKGEKFLVELTATALTEPRTGQRHYLVAMVDITERQRAYEQIENQNHELERANEGLSTFAYVASHDLQEPLRKIRQFVDLLEGDFGDRANDEGQYYMNVISGSAARISYLVKDILAYTTVSHAEVDITDLDLADVVGAAVDDLASTLKEKDVKLTVGKLPKVRGDATGAKLMFQNLIGNAIKYQPEGAKPTVSIKSKALKNSTVIEIADNGIGIEDEKQDVFEPFVRLHSKFEYAGTGIGLAICLAVCHRMEWQISHRPNKSGGTIFSITIPNTD